MRSIKPTRRRRRVLVAFAALTVLAAACSASKGPDIESLGLAMEVDIQAGAIFEVAVPMMDDTTISVVQAPPGVAAIITPGIEPGTILLQLAVDRTTPRGAYNLAISVVQDGDEYELGWPFNIVEPLGAVATTWPASV